MTESHLICVRAESSGHKPTPASFINALTSQECSKRTKRPPRQHPLECPFIRTSADLILQKQETFVVFSQRKVRKCNQYRPNSQRESKAVMLLSSLCLSLWRSENEKPPPLFQVDLSSSCVYVYIYISSFNPFIPVCSVLSSCFFVCYFVIIFAGILLL